MVRTRGEAKYPQRRRKPSSGSRGNWLGLFTVTAVVLWLSTFTFHDNNFPAFLSAAATDAEYG